MFTGIIEAVGSVKSVLPLGGDLRVTVDVAGLDMSDVALGDSIATNGVCLTAVAYDKSTFSADVSQETLDHSRIRAWRPGQPVNLEKALLPTTRLGGHLVSGHVDGVAKVTALSKDARSVRLEIEPPAELIRYIAAKGSITIDGVSLTVNLLRGARFELNIVPHTASTTVIDTYRVGQEVHLEVDMIARYLERMLTFNGQQWGDDQTHTGVTEAFLQSAGYSTKGY